MENTSSNLQKFLLNIIKDKNNFRFESQNTYLRINLTRRYEKFFEFTIQTGRDGKSAFVNELTPYGGSYDILIFKLSGSVDSNSISCSSIDIVKDSNFESYAGRSDSNQIEYNFEKACEFINEILEKLAL